MKKRLFSIVMVAMLALSSAAMPNALSTPYTAHASANYANTQIESYARQVAGIVNRERAANGLSPLKYSDKLSEAALVRAEEIQTVFSHTRPNGTRCFTAVTEAGINYSSVGENIAYGQRTPEEVMNSWMNSSGHRANILGSYEYIGIGVTYKNGTYYWSQFFATSKDLSGEVITLNDSSTTTASATKPTSAATASATKPTSAATVSTTEPTSAATSSATKPTSAATVSTTEPTSAATVSTTEPTSAATSSTTKPSSGMQNIEDFCENNKNCSWTVRIMRILAAKLGGKAGCSNKQ